MMVGLFCKILIVEVKANKNHKPLFALLVLGQISKSFKVIISSTEWIVEMLYYRFEKIARLGFETKQSTENEVKIILYLEFI